MGYIAPVTNFQYMQYAERVAVTPKIHDPMPVTNVHRVENRSKFMQILQDESMSMQAVSKKAYKSSDHTEKKTDVPARLFSQMTGKGKHINDYA